MTGTQSHEALAGVAAAVEYLAELGRMVAGQRRQVAQGSTSTDEQEAQPPDSEARESQYDVSDAATSPSRRQALLAAMHAIQAYERGLAEQLITGLLEIPGLTFYGISDPARFDRRTPTVAVRIAGHTPHELAAALGERGIFTWDGNYYAINLSERLGVEAAGGMLRIGLVHYNTTEEVGRLLAALGEIATGGPR
jgi:selenocysteine lyase/cysteine desulfurase